MKIVECPRDAMQGLSTFIPTEKKIDYINSLIKVGYDIIDFGSFVSSKLVPQMRDTVEVIQGLELQDSTSLLSIVLNKRGAVEASSFEKIDIIGYPLSVSEIFQQKNSKKTIESSLLLIDEIQDICIKKNKTLLIYFSMAFGNPYGEYWDVELLLSYIQKIEEKCIKMISLADTIGSSTPKLVSSVFNTVIQNFNSLDIGLHLHSTPDETYEKISQAWDAGCNRFDVAIGGYGGCPFAQNDLIGNLSTEKFVNFLTKKKINHSLDLYAFENACNYAKKIFN